MRNTDPWELISNHLSSLSAHRWVLGCFVENCAVVIFVVVVLVALQFQLRRRDFWIKMLVKF